MFTNLLYGFLQDELPSKLWIGIPRDVWIVSILAAVVGVVLLASSQRLRNHKFSKELLRDVGIAFLVAGIISFCYEWITESAAERRRAVVQNTKMADTLYTILKYNIPPKVWKEVDESVYHGEAIRRNVNIVFRLHADPRLPAGLAALDMKYTYSLYGLKSSSSDVDIEHDVVEHKEYGDLPSFKYVSISRFDGTRIIELDGDALKQQGMLKTFKDTVHLEPGYSFNGDQFDDSKAVQVITDRVEVINVPGSYSVGIPVIIEGPITISLEVPKEMNIQPQVETQWARHTFDRTKRENGDYAWTFAGILLPGQTFNIIFREPKSPSSSTLLNPTNPSQ